MSKPRVIVNCVANTYTGPNERIVEFAHTTRDGAHLGGLIKFIELDGQLIVDVYNVDPGVTVRTPAKPTTT